MSLLSRLVLFIIFGLLLSGGFWFLQKRKEDAEKVQQRYVSLLEKSVSEPESVIGSLNELLDEEEISENELLLLFELCLESPNHSIDPLLPLLERKRSDETLLADWQTIEACVQYKLGDLAGSLKKLNQLFNDHPANRRTNYEYQKIRWMVGGIDERVGAKRALFDLSQSDDRWSYKALRALCFSPPREGMPKDDLIKALEAMRSHSLITSEDALKASELLIQVDEKRDFDEVFQELLSMKKDQLNPVDLGYWLIQIGQPRTALGIVSQLDSLKDEDFFFIRFQAMLETNQTEEAEALFEKANHLSPGKRLQANAYLSLVRGEEGALDAFLTGAENLGSAKSLLDVSRLALIGGNAAVAYRSFQQAWKISPSQFNLSQANQFLQISLVSRNTKEAHQITGEIHRRFPEKFGNANNHCYLSLLLGENLEIQEKEAQRITEAFPGNPTFLSTLALAKLVSGKPQEALKVMNNRGPVPLTHGEKALLACMLEAAGNKEDARKIALTLKEGRMLPEEWRLLKKHGLAGT